jgi:hypothetical protein
VSFHIHQFLADFQTGEQLLAAWPDVDQPVEGRGEIGVSELES